MPTFEQNVPAAYAAYSNVARHNLLEVLNHIAKKAGLSTTENDDQVGDHPLLKKLQEWAKAEENNQSLSDKDIRVLKQVVKGLQKALPIVGDSFAQNVSGQKIYVDVQELHAQKRAQAGSAPRPQHRSRSSEKPIRTWRVSDLHWILQMLTQKLMALRNYYSHAYQDEVGLGEPLENLLGIWFDAGRREAKDRFNYSTDDMAHLLRFGGTGRQAKLNPHAEHALTEKPNGARRLTEKGTAFFLCLFLDRQQGNELLKQIAGFKSSQSAAHQATLRTYTHWHIRIPFVRIETDGTPQTLALDMLSELARCPAEIYNNLSTEDQKQFDIAPEADEGWMNADDAEGLNVRFIRHGDRFAPLLLDYFDHLAKNQPDHDIGIRFALDLGDFYFAAYPKRLTDGSSEIRRLKQKVVRFGLRSEALQQAEQKPPEWQALERVNTDRDYDQPYIVQTQPHYHFNEAGGSIPIKLKTNKAVYYDAPQIDRDKTNASPNPNGTPRYQTLPSQRPDFWLSPHELVNLAFYHHLRTAHGLPEREFPRVEILLISYRSSLKCLYDSMQQKPRDWYSNSLQDLDVKLQAFCEQSNSKSHYTLRSQDLPSDLLVLLLNKATPAAAQMHSQAQNTLKLLVQDGESRLEDIRRVQKSLNDSTKPGKRGHRVLRAGEMATFLAKDIVRLQPVQDANSAHKGKPTSIMANLLQARLAYFGREKNSLPALFRSLGLMGHEQVDKNHPFLQKIDLNAPRMNGIAQFYEAYLQQRKQHLETLQTELKSKGESALQNPAFAWLNLAQVPQRLQDRNNLQSLLARYMKCKDEPLNLPRGLFGELTIKALMSLKDLGTDEQQKKGQQLQLYDKLNELRDAEDSRGRFTSPSQYVEWYMVYMHSDGPQENIYYHPATDPATAFCLDSDIAEMKNANWKNSEWAEKTRKRLRQENHHGKTPQQALQDEHQEQLKKLRSKNCDFYRTLHHRATQDQVLFLAAKRLMALNQAQAKATNKNKGASVDEAQTNPLEQIMLATLRRDLDQMVPYEIKIHGKTIYVEAIKVKNIGLFKRLARDRRLSGLLHYYDAKRIHLSMVRHELQAYPRAQNQAFAQVLAFERAQNAQQKLQADTLPKGQSLHRELVQRSLGQSSLPYAERDRLQAEILTLRNAFCHNQISTPPEESDKAAQHPAAPMWQAARAHLASARQEGSSVADIRKDDNDQGRTVADYFAQALAERYTKMLKPWSRP